MKLSIKEAYIARFYEKSVDGNNMSLYIDEYSTEHRNCVIDDEKGEAVDIDSKFIYHILKRNDNGMITSEEAQNVVLGAPYVLSMQEVKWQQMGLIEKRILCLKAFIIDGDRKREAKKSLKVKTLSKKDSKIK